MEVRLSNVCHTTPIDVRNKKSSFLEIPEIANIKKCKDDFSFKGTEGSHSSNNKTKLAKTSVQKSSGQNLMSFDILKLLGDGNLKKVYLA